MNPIRHDVTFAFIVFIGLIFLFFSPRYSWIETPGSVVMREIERDAHREGVTIPDLDDTWTTMLEKVYQERRYWNTVQWPYGWNFHLKYPLIALFIFGFVSFIQGIGLIPLFWTSAFWAASIPSVLLLLAVILEYFRGSSIQQGFWFCLFGAFLIVFGTYMMKPTRNPEPCEGGNSE